MINIKFTGPVIISLIFSQSFLPVLAWKTTEKNMEDFLGSRWAIVSHQKYRFSLLIGESVEKIIA